MPIYDNNGSVNAQIARVYDNNGTTNAQIARVYDNNGSTNTLVYQNRLNVVPGASLVSAYSDSGAPTISGTRMYILATVGDYRGVLVAYLNKDIRGYNTLYYNTTREGWVGQPGYFPTGLFIGTLAQLQSIRFEWYDNLNPHSATTIKLTYGENLGAGTYAIPASLKNASSAVYLAGVVGAYNGSEAALTFNTVYVE